MILPKLLITILFTALLLMPTQSFPQGKGTIEGYVKDAKTEEPLPGANIIITGTQLGAAADPDGYFRISNIPVGSYKLKVTMLGYRTVLRTMEVSAGQTVKVNFLLQTAILKLTEGLVVTAKPLTTFNSAMPLSIVDKTQLRRANPVTTAEALKSVSGISMARPGIWGVKPIIQGLKDDRIVVLVDGARLNQACPMGMDACVATINPDQIERIEVIKGPHSVAYGSGNLGGVINIITKNPSSLKKDVLKIVSSLGIGYYSTSAGRTGRLNLEGGYKTLDFSLGSGIRKYEDYHTVRGTVPNSGFSSSDVDVKLGWKFRQYHRLQFLGQQYYGKDIGYPAASVVIPRERRRLYTLNYSANKLSEGIAWLTATASLQSLTHNARPATASREALFNENAHSDTYSGSLKSGFVLSRNYFLTLGLDFYHWNMEATRQYHAEDTEQSLISVVPNAYQRDVGLFAEGKVAISAKFDLTFGARVDRAVANADLPEDAKTNGTVSDQFIGGNLGLLYRISNGVNVTASWGRGFKPATPVERYLSSPMSDGYQHVGTPHLKPEKSHSVRLGVKGMTNRFQWEIAVFQNNLTDFISAEVDPNLLPPDPGLKGVKRYVNFGKATIRGLESAWSLSITRTFSLSGSVTYTWGEDQSRDQPLPQIPPLESDVKIKYQNNKLWGEFTGRLVADQERFNFKAGEVRTPGFAVFDLRAGVKFTENLSLNLAVENIFNLDYRQHLNLAQLPEPGRNFYLGLNLGMQLDKSLFWKLTKSKPVTERVTLKVEGMDCRFCAQTVRSILGKMDGVVSVEVDFEKGLAAVEFEKGKISISQLIESLNNAGYKAR